MSMASELVARHGHRFQLSGKDAVIRWLITQTSPGASRRIAPWVASAQVWQLLYALADSAEQGHDLPENAMIGSARRLIASRLTDRELTVETLAYDLGVSREHLSRTFARAVGATPRRYIEELRLRMALQVLGRTGLSILAVARQCGWNDAETFSAAFRRAHGQLPSHWRSTRGSS
jgi:AraC-like DNA-binding protein